MPQSKKTLFQQLVNLKDRSAEYDKGTPRYSMGYRILILTFTVAASAILFTFHFEQGDNRPYKYDTFPRMEEWQGKTIYSDITYPVYKEKSIYQREVKEAKDKALPVFFVNKEEQAKTISLIEGIFAKLANDSLKADEFTEIQFKDNVINNFLSQSKNEKKRNLATVERELKEFYDNIYSSGFIDRDLETIETGEIRLFYPPNREVVIKKSAVVSKSEFESKANDLIASKIPASMREISHQIIESFNVPNLYYDSDLSEKAENLAAQSVPRTIDIVRKGEVVVKNGQSLNDTLRMKIQSYERSKMMTSENVYSTVFVIGSTGHAAFLYGILLLYLFVIRKDIFYDNVKLGLLSTIIILSAFFSWLSIEIPSELPLELLVVIPAFSMLTAIVFDSRTAFYVTVTMSLMLAGIRGNDYIIGATMIFGGTLAAYTVRDVQSRTQMFQSMFFISIGLILPTAIFGAERSTGWDDLFQRMGFSVITAGASPLITFGLLFLLERLTNVSTDLRIKEYDNLNHPLLVKMNEVAPGTYQHTLGVALLAERAAVAIGANALLSKVAAYYHDIGKIPKAEYFTENQIGFENKHDKLTPKRSASIIRDHVTDGIEIAKQYKLPERLIDFIPMHHGTDLIKHFYAQALEEDTTNSVDERDYRYPGPKPRSKEAALLMICDSAEAISRVIGQDMNAIKDLIEKNIQERMLDGQFDESNITLKEIRIIKDTIMKNILGSAHKRVSYKAMPEKEV